MNQAGISDGWLNSERGCRERDEKENDQELCAKFHFETLLG